jgi:hypothetical protein
MSVAALARRMRNRDKLCAHNQCGEELWLATAVCVIWAVCFFCATVLLPLFGLLTVSIVGQWTNNAEMLCATNNSVFSRCRHDLHDCPCAKEGLPLFGILAALVLVGIVATHAIERLRMAYNTESG